jgi:hypothetical protein
MSRNDDYDNSVSSIRSDVGCGLRVRGPWRSNRILASFGRFIVRTITFDRIQIASETDETTAMAISNATLFAIFVSFLIIASRVH